MDVLVDRCVVKKLWKIPESDTSQDAYLDLLIQLASTRIVTEAGRSFNYSTYTEYVSGGGEEFIFLRNTPVDAIVSLWFNRAGYWGDGEDAFETADLLVEGVDYALHRSRDGKAKTGMVYRINNVWENPEIFVPNRLNRVNAAITGNIKVTYTAGYKEIPSDLQMATVTLASNIAATTMNGGTLISESWDGYAYSLADTTNNPGGLPKAVLGVLSRYRRTAVG